MVEQLISSGWGCAAVIGLILCIVVVCGLRRFGRERFEKEQLAHYARGLEDGIASRRK